MNMHVITSTVNAIFIIMRLYIKGYTTFIYKIILINLDKNNQNNTSNLSFFREY